ncbi:Predicted DEAD-box-containing helicase [Phaffia rhodozyma]|uniref:Predicted DEAD-box-containing helicase n=1 Tax=Phaffia rhodozyma TaxID=264483 RepID=A0A0F7SW57_PHARH|nr:Predicted DEAD-box-containing helicase [Phaffia rhodozyma]
MHCTMADDLEDDYVQGADEFLSEGEGSVYDDEGAADIEGEGLIPEIPTSKPIAGSKRKAGGQDGEDEDDEDENDGQTGASARVDMSNMTAEEKKKEKKRRNKEKLKEKKKLRMTDSLTKATLVNSTSEASSTSGLLSLLRKNQRLALSALSDLEWDDWELPESAILQLSTSIPSPPTLSSLLQNLPRPLPKSPPTVNGAPHVLILASSGIRCADLVRELRDIIAKESGVVPVVEGEDSTGSAKGYGKGKTNGKGKGKTTGDSKGNGEIAKLFAKHFKLAEHITYLSTTKISLAVGTPHRVGELIRANALKPPPYILLDLTYKDAKSRTLLESPEGRAQIWKDVLGKDSLLDRLRLEDQDEGAVRIGAF